MKPRELVPLAVERLKTMGDPVRAAGARRYFKGTIECYGVTAPGIRALAAELYGLVKDTWTVDDAIALCDLAFSAPELETKAIGALILLRFKKTLPRFLLAKAKGWLAGNRLDNWASVDGFCPEIVGALLIRYPELVAEIRGWPAHPNRWVKRASAVSFLKLAKKPEFRAALYANARALLPVEDDLVQKANGWLLREAGKGDAARLEAFLLKHGPRIPRTTLRYAIERFPERRRRSILLRTRSAGGAAGR
jgi:3-methyladenine DNA glycosylase AlkD